MDRPIAEDGPHLHELLREALVGDAPLYRQLATGLKRAIDHGEIPLGTVLPPERSLARELAVSRSTVVAAYDRLKTEGWLESRQGSGTWVRRPPDANRGGVDAIATRRLFLEASDPEPLRAAEPTGAPEPIELSVAAMTASPTVERLLGSLTSEDIAPLVAHHGYMPRGLPLLRDVIAQRMTAEGLATRHDQVVVTTGAHQAISLIVRQVLQPGDTVIVESPTFPGALDIFRRFDARAIPLPVDHHGARIDLLPDLLDRTEAQLVYVSPHFHNPTGTVLPEERRQLLAELADERGVVVIEDHAMADLALDEEPVPPPVAAYANRDNIHTVGSVSKLCWAGLRIGWSRSPESWSTRMLSTKTVADLGSPAVSQFLAARMLEHADEILRERQAQLRSRRHLMCELLASFLPTWTWRRPAGGLSVWATLPDGNAEEFAEVALRHGVSIIPGPSLSVDGGNRRAVRLVYAADEATIREGMRRVAQAWATYSPEASHLARLIV